MPLCPSLWGQNVRTAATGQFFVGRSTSGVDKLPPKQKKTSQLKQFPDMCTNNYVSISISVG